MCLRACRRTLLHAGVAYQLASGQAASGGWGLQLHRWPEGHAGPCRAARPADAGMLDWPAACQDGSPALRCLAGPSPQRACLNPHSHLRPVSSALDRWLISEQLRARVSREPRAIGQVVGYPGDHLGVSLSLTSPASTLHGSAAWRQPLQLLDDQPFCERIAAEVPAYLADMPIWRCSHSGQPLTSSGRWRTR